MKKEGNDKKVTSRRSPRHKLAPRDPKGGRPPQEIAAQLGEHILQVALDQFIAHGVEGANMDDIAAAANVSKRTLYSRYGSKTQLLIASAEHGTQRHLKAITVDRRSGDLRNRLLKLCRKMLDAALKPEVIGIETLATWIFERKLEAQLSIHRNPGASLIQDLLTEEARVRNIEEDLPFLAAFIFDATVIGPRARILLRKDLANTARAKTEHLAQTMDLLARAVPLLEPELQHAPKR